MFNTRTALGEEVSILCAPAAPAAGDNAFALVSPTHALESRFRETSFFNKEREIETRFGADAEWQRASGDSSSSTSSSPENGFSSTETATPMSSASTTRSSSFSNGAGFGNPTSSIKVEHYQPNESMLRRPTYCTSPPSESQSRGILLYKRTQSLPCVPQKRSPTEDADVREHASIYRPISQSRMYPDLNYTTGYCPSEPPRQVLPGIAKLLGTLQDTIRPPILSQTMEPISRRSSGIDPLELESGAKIVAPPLSSASQSRPIKLERLDSRTSIDSGSYSSHTADPIVGLSPTPSDCFLDRSQSETSSRSPSPSKRRRSEKISDTVAGSNGVAGSSVASGRPASKRKFPCQTCGKFFTTSGHLSRHGRTHTGERKYECPHESCDARFSRQDNCMQHFRTHTNNDSRRKKRRPAASTTSSTESIPMSTIPICSDGPDMLAALANVAALADRGALPV